MHIFLVLFESTLKVAVLDWRSGICVAAGAGHFMCSVVLLLPFSPYLSDDGVCVCVCACGCADLPAVAF
jgi:hypothetical protein